MRVWFRPFNLAIVIIVITMIILTVRVHKVEEPKKKVVAPAPMVCH